MTATTAAHGQPRTDRHQRDHLHGVRASHGISIDDLTTRAALPIELLETVVTAGSEGF